MGLDADVILLDLSLPGFRSQSRRVAQEGFQENNRCNSRLYRRLPSRRELLFQPRDLGFGIVRVYSLLIRTLLRAHRLIRRRGASSVAPSSAVSAKRLRYSV
jgi:hypothetical protein